MDQLPRFLRDLIASFPQAGDGVHRHLFRLARYLHALRSKPDVFTPGGPRRGDSARLPVSRCRRRQRVNVAVDTPNSRITSGRGVPRSSASSARIRKSREYAFIPSV